MAKLLTAVLLLLCARPVLPQFYYFGTNKVQYNNFEWRVLHTAHFDIYYYGGMEQIATIGAGIAEQAFSEYKALFSHTLASRIPLIFYNTHIHFQQTNTTPGAIPEGVGGFFEFIKGRVVIPYMGSLAQFRHVIRHELVHVFMTTKVYRQLTERRLPSDRFPPLWFTEGIAEFYSTTWDEQAEMVLRDAVFSGYFTGLKEFYRLNGTFVMYKQGQAFFEFIKRQYGAEKVMLLVDNFWMYEDFYKLIEYVLGKPVSEIDDEWLAYLRKQYYPLLSRFSTLKPTARQITTEGFAFMPAAYAMAGDTTICFMANIDGYSSLYTVSRGKENKYLPPKLLLRGEKTEEFESFHLFRGRVSVSQSGMVAFVAKSGAADAIHLLSLASREVVASFRNPSLVSISSPSFSSGGDSLVFEAVDTSGFSDIYLIQLRSNNVIRLTDDYYQEKDPILSIDGRTVYFVSDRTTGTNEKFSNLFACSLTDGTIRYVTYIPADIESPFLFPGGNRIGFTAGLDSVANVFSVSLTPHDGQGVLLRHSAFTTSVFNPTVAGNTLLFSGFSGLSFSLYEMPLSTDTSWALPFTLPGASAPWTEAGLTTATEQGKIRYEKEYTLDYAQSQISTDPVFGTRGGAVLSLSDLLGDDTYYFMLYNTAQVQEDFLKSFNIALSRVSLKSRSNFGYGIFHFSGRRYDIRDSDEFFYERSFGGYFSMQFPLSRFSRLEADISIANSDKQVLTGVIERKALLWTNSVSYVADNTLWLPTGPVDGSRYRLLLSYTSDVKFSNVNYYTIIADYRYYQRLTLRSTFAFRGALFYNEGKEARRYFMGGSWDLRGWPRWSIRGEKMWLASLELRAPLIDQVRVKFPFLDVSFVGLRGALFADAGSAWDKTYQATLGSVGGGLRFNLFGVVVFRYDVGKKIENNLKSFQPGLFYQFFFGWDF